MVGVEGANIEKRRLILWGVYYEVAVLDQAKIAASFPDVWSFAKVGRFKR